MANPTANQARFGWCLYDWANSAFATVILASVLPVYFVSLVPEEGALLSLFGLSRTVPAAALWGYAVSCSMLLVALSAPFLGAFADSGGHRRRLLIFFCLLGSSSTALLCLAGPGRYLLAAGLFILANIGFASGNVFYNSFLPQLAGEEGLDRLSSRGFAYGYLGGGIALAIVFALIQGHHLLGFADKGVASRAGFLFTGLWWALFAVPAMLFLRDRPRREGATRIAGFKGYLKTLAEIRRYRDLLLFLVAFLFYNDGIQTIIVVSAIFGRQELQLSEGTILGCFLMIQFVAMPGTLFFGRLAERFGAKKTVLLTLFTFIGVTLYAFYIESASEFWLLGFVVAVIFGGSQAVSRSLFASLIPEGKSAEFFAFYAISSKFASILGPLIFALIADLTGSTRLSILALASFFIVGILLLSFVDVKRGEAAARGE